MQTPLRLCAILLLSLSTTNESRAGDEPKWERKGFDCERPERGCHIASCCAYGFGVYTREKPGSELREVRAVGEVDATPEKVFELVSDYEHQVGNMPYVEDAKVFSRTAELVRFWARADFPLVSKRDWVLQSKLERNLPGGIFRVSWEPADVREAPAPQAGIVRLKVNTGNWTLEPLDQGQRTRATYYLFTDPGGSVPAFIANKANTTALPELFARVRKRCEAARP